MKTIQRRPTLRRRPVFVGLAASTLVFGGLGTAAADPSQQAQHPASQQPSTANPQSMSEHRSQAKSAEDTIRQWPSASREVAQEIIGKYGEPDAVTEHMLVWRDNGPWLRTIVHREPVQHDFPMPHEDVLEQVIAYEVPEEKFSELARFDGSIVANRTAGELSARCGQEAANILALNLAHEIVEGQRSVEEARSHLADSIQQVMRGEEPEDAQDLMFETQTVAQTADPDEPVISEQAVAAESTPSRRTGSTSGDSTSERAGDQAAAAAAAGTAGAASAMQSEGESIASMLGREFIGKDVVSSDDEVVGEVAEVTLDEQGRHVARIELGGFLGLAQEEMQLPLSELTVGTDGNLRTELTKDELESRQKQSQDRD